MFGREMRSKLPELRREMQATDEEVRERDWLKKAKGKWYAGGRRGATDSAIKAGDVVLVKAQKINKLSSNFNPSPFLVVKKEGGEVTLRSDEGVEMKRNASFLRKYNIEDDGISAELNGGVADHAADIPTELHGDVTDDTTVYVAYMYMT